jgi:hypothetical protein
MWKTEAMDINRIAFCEMLKKRVGRCVIAHCVIAVGSTLIYTPYYIHKIIFSFFSLFFFPIIKADAKDGRCHTEANCKKSADRDAAGSP